MTGDHMNSDMSDTTGGLTEDEVQRLLSPYYEYVGRIAGEWASLEFKMDLLIWQLAGVVHSAGACITSQLNGINVRLRILTALVRLRTKSDSLIKKISKFEASVFPVLEQRNRIVHDWWGVSGETKEVLQMRVALVAKSLDLRLKATSLDELRNVHRQVMACWKRFDELESAIASSIPAESPEPLVNILHGSLGKR
jgi:hypothetical protein